LFGGVFKRQCVACGATRTAITKEHFWPAWLIAHTGTHRTGVRFDAKKRINPRRLTVPLCRACNADFGRELEGPVAQIFRDIENGRGVSDLEAEILVRWLWKFEGLAWRFAHPHLKYTDRYTLRQRVLNPIDDIRPDLALAIGLSQAIEPEFDDAPMGLDSFNEVSAVFVAGVFSRIAIMVLLAKFISHVPSQYSIYRFSPIDARDRHAKLFYPSATFPSCVEAVGITKSIAARLSELHDIESQMQRARITGDPSVV